MRINIIEEVNQIQNSNSSAQGSEQTLPFTRGILQTVWESMRQMSGSERNLLIRHINNRNTNEASSRSSSTSEGELQIRSYIFNHRMSESLTYQHIQNEQNFILDFQLYPLNIDWREIEINNRTFHKIYQQYGYFAAALLTSLNRIENIKFSSYLIFHFTIINYVSILFKNDNYKELYEFVNCLPNLQGIKKILEKKYYQQKELTTIKIVLDIYTVFSFEDHLIKSTGINIRNLIDCLNLFYNSCSDNDITMIKEAFSENRKLVALMSKHIFYFL